MWDSLDALSTKLNEFFQNPSNKKDPLPTLKQGMFCCAQFTEDEAWYRARITETPTQGDSPQAHVIYVDFGNSEIIPVSRLCMLRKEHAELPMMAVLCALDGAIPTGGEKKWSTASVKRFEELCSVAEVLHMTVVRADGHHLYVELVDSEGNNVAATLEKEGYSMLQRDTDSSSTSSSTRSSLSTSSVTPSSSTDSFVSVTTKTSSASSSGQSSAVSTSDSIRREGGDSEERKPIAVRPFLRHRLLSKDEESQKIPERVQIPDEEFIDVFVCNVHSTDNICVNLSGGEYAEKLLALEQSMLCHYEDSTAEETVKAVPGSICAVYSQEIHSDGLWYRVKVLKVKGDKVLIEYMDYGDKGIIPITSLWSIPSRFLELPFQACTVSLHGLPKTKNPEVLLKVKHMTLNKDIVAQVIKRDGNTASVELYDTSSEVDININTMLQRLVIPDEDMAPLLPKVGEQVEAFVTYVTPEGHVFVQIPGGGTMRLHELMEDIAEHYSGITKAAEFVSSPHKDKMCCAHCSDGVWYRAIVTNVFPEREVEVQYVDFGNTEVLPLSSLREPTRAISHVNSLPFQALECKLEGTDKQGLTEEQAEMITERNVFLEVVQLADVPLVRLFVSSEDEEDALVNLGEVLGLETEEQSETFDEAASAGIDSSTLEYHDDDKDSVTSESSTEASKPVEDDNMTTSLLSKQWVDICILEADNPSKFRFQCLELLQQSEELEEKIQHYYTGRSRTPLRDIRPGVFCAVYHVEDDMWYRAVIKAPFSRQQTCVRFADYGDFGLVPSANLQALPDEFRELPPMAVEGCLHGVEPVGEDLAQWSQEAIDRFGELTTDKKLVAKPRGVASHSRLTNEETKVSLELFDTSEGNEDVLIADVLINEGLAKKINES
ncbi:tudor domain-containing protein 1-like isoform X2 [Stylophora pistillata]|uniref:tudor domain-containing protein 1-like isoform X2 n=1 Tax=Stylophora pistillata TaxID=50429 RepID=UPI000C056BE5|nr:tudor domain-containing protein 1-like isoform X2 [Stylophora pistillata]